MPTPLQAAISDTDSGEFQKVVALLGGDRMLRHRVNGPFDAHELILEGMPGAALLHLVDHLGTLPKSTSFEKAVGMSLRTIQRRKEAPSQRLNQEQSGRTWKFEYGVYT